MTTAHAKGTPTKGHAQVQLSAALLALTVAAAGCFSPLVGEDCSDGYTSCGGGCVNLATSSQHCGACDNPCSGQCSAGACRASGSADGGDAAPASDGLGDDGLDGSGDSSLGTTDADLGADAPADANNAPADANVDGGPGPVPSDMAPPGDRPATDAPDGPPVVPTDAASDGVLPQTIDARDGGPSIDGPTADRPPTDAPIGSPSPDGSTPDGPPVGLSDAPPGDGLNVDGGDAGDVPPPPACEVGAPNFCTDRCVELDRDPDNCGRCGNRCVSGICAAGSCQAGRAGHIVVIGHDYVVGRTGMNNLVGNAVFLSLQNPARVLAFEGRATAASINGTNNAIQQVASDTGRSWIRTVTSADDVGTMLAASDVLVIHSQANSDDATLAALGRNWKIRLEMFLEGGNTVILLDGASPTNRGTYQILTAANLFAATGRSEVTGQTLTVVSPGDALAARVPRTYRAESTSVSFDVAGANRVVETLTGKPVVVHMAF